MTLECDEIQTYLEDFNHWINHYTSVSRMLEELCGGKITAEQKQESDIPFDNIAFNYVSETNCSFAYRCVNLCGNNQLLLEANNWYFPQMLTVKMVELLKNTNQPFGFVVRGLNFTRKIVETKFSPENYKTHKSILSHSVVLYNENNQPFSFVKEYYLPQTLKLFINLNKMKRRTTKY